MTAPAASSRSTTVASYGRDEGVEDPRRGRRAHAADAQVVLQRDRHAGERPECGPGRALAIDLPGARERALGGDEVERIQRGVGLLDARERGAADLDGRRLCRRRSPSRISRASVSGVIR